MKATNESEQIVNAATFPIYFEKYEILVEIPRSNTSAMKSQATRSPTRVLNVHSCFVFVN